MATAAGGEENITESRRNKSMVCYTTHMKLRLPLIILAVFLAACMPAATPKTTKITARGAEVTLDPMLGARVEISYVLSDFGLARDDLKTFVSLPLGVDGTSTEVSSTFFLQDTRIPDGWKASIQSAWFDEVVVRGSFGRESTRESLRIILSIVPESGAVAGPYRIRTNIAASNGRDSLVTFTGVIR